MTWAGILVVGSLALRPPSVAAGPKKFYWIRSLWKLYIIFRCVSTELSF